jgi:hypothetical protein
MYSDEQQLINEDSKGEWIMVGDRRLVERDEWSKY